jgi:putative ABC transport system permease protein
VLADVRLALRGLLKHPRFTGVAALTLALGIGAVTAIFSVVNGVLLKPLPYPEPERLVNIWSNAAGLSLNQFPLSPDLYFFLRREARSFEETTAFRRRDVNLTDAGDPEVVSAAETTFTYFSTFRLTPERGQLYAAAHDVPGAPLVVVISHRIWQQRFGTDPGVVGKPIQIDGEPATIIGVLPRTLDESGSPDLWMPARLDPARPPTGNFGWPVAARLKPGIEPAAAEAELVPIVARLLDGIQGADYRAFLTQGRYRMFVHPVREDVIGEVQRPLWILMGTVGSILLIACVNVANLCLIRAEGRQREMAVRAALGATRAGLVRTQLIEAFVLAGIGGGLGVLMASLSVPALVRAAPTTIPRLNLVGIDATVLLAAAAATALAALIFGIAPAVRYTSPAALGALRQGGRGSSADRIRHRGRRVLVIVQTAMTLVLLVGSGLLVRSFSRMLHADLGFNPAGVLTFRVALPRSGYPNLSNALDFEARLIERIAALPGVEVAGAASRIPMVAGMSGTAFEIDGRPTPAGQLPPLIRYKHTAPGYVEAMGLRLVRGRTLDRRDLAPDSRDVLVNQALADAFWPGADPIGRRLRPSGSTDAAGAPLWYSVAGVVSSELADGFRREPPLTIYFPLGALYGRDAWSLTYVLRGPLAADQAGAARAAVWAIDPRLPVAAVQTMEEVVARSIVAFTFTMLTLGIAAAVALVLGTIGLFGLLSYAVTLRRREIGVRLALGAQPARVMTNVLGQGLAIVGVGLLIGLGGAVALTRFLSGLLYDTPALDAPTFAAVAVVLLAVAGLASYLPARRAASVSPLESLRLE